MLCRMLCKPLTPLSWIRGVASPVQRIITNYVDTMIYVLRIVSTALATNLPYEKSAFLATTCRKRLPVTVHRLRTIDRFHQSCFNWESSQAIRDLPSAARPTHAPTHSN